MNSHIGCLLLIKLFCLTSTSAHTHYLIYLLKSVAVTGGLVELVVSSEARILLHQR